MVMLRKVKAWLRCIINEIRTIFPLENVNHTEHGKNALLVYLRKPFQTNTANGYHQNIEQIREIAKIIGGFGYNVDAINYNERLCIFRKKYDFVFDICAFDRPIYHRHLKPDARRVIYFTGSESKFANNAELARIQAVAKRKGVLLEPRCQASLIPTTVVDYDCAILIGNKYNLQSYAGFELKNVHLVSNTGYNFDMIFDISKKRSDCFCFFGSSGAVHKGLDLLLDIFSEPDFPATLYVCGEFEQEEDFVKLYRKELYHTPNIVSVGFVDIWSDEFKALVEMCAYTILPSCSEGQAGSVTTMMSAGVIPICSKECGFDKEDVVLLPDCEMETIRTYILTYAQKSQEWIEKEGQKAKELAKTRFNIEVFSNQMKKALSTVL